LVDSESTKVSRRNLAGGAPLLGLVRWSETTTEKGLGTSGRGGSADAHGRAARRSCGAVDPAGWGQETSGFFPTAYNLFLVISVRG
jgi:hypothetical protein